MPQDEIRDNSIVRAFKERLLHEKGFRGEFRDDHVTRILYSTDASIYQVEPLGVVFPRNIDDIGFIANAANELNIPITARGSGSSLAGQAIGASIIMDCSKYINKIIEINAENRQAVVEPGVILTSLNKTAAKLGLQFGPDPASAERATLGGCIANNAAGAHSILYGMTGDHLISADVVFANGDQGKLQTVDMDQAGIRSQNNDSLGKFYRAAMQIRQKYENEIKSMWPATWRRASGYNLNYLLPWSPSQPPQWKTTSAQWESAQTGYLPYPPVQPNTLNLAHLLAGSEGTLGLIQKATLRLVPLPRHTILGVLSYPGIPEACEAVPDLLQLSPSAIELIPRSLIRLARSVPAYADQLSFVSQFTHDGFEPEALLVVEFSGDDRDHLLQIANQLREDVFVAETRMAQNRVWAVRKVGLGILMSRPGNNKPVAFIEDMAVPVSHLGRFVQEMDVILRSHGTEADYYAHASAGCLHIRPILNLKETHDVKMMRSIASAAVELVLNLQGAVAAEHGDGLARSEWLEKAYGQTIIRAFEELKRSVDPKKLLNPGKIIDPLPMDENLRYGGTYISSRTWKPAFYYHTSINKPGDTGLAAAIEQCNGAGVCRKPDGVMCPSFQANQEEMHSTRGRSNLLRALISGRFIGQDRAESAVREALDLCLACKGCKSECPSGVDIAKLKYEFTNHYYQDLSHHRPYRDYLFGYLGFFGRLGYPFRILANPILKSRLFKSFGRHLLGLAVERNFPQFSKKAFGVSLDRQKDDQKMIDNPTVLFLSDAFTEYFHVEAGLAAVKLLRASGCKVKILPVLGAGRTLISKGFLEPARKHAAQLLKVIQSTDPDGRLPVVGVEPSEIYTLRDEYLDFFPENTYMAHLAQRSWMVDEYLVRPGANGLPLSNTLFRGDEGKDAPVLLHGHCYQKAQPPSPDGYPIGVLATQTLLETAGYQVIMTDSGCCGMAGAFGYEAEHYHFSQQVGEYSLFPAIRNALEKNGSIPVVTPGVSCLAQIQDGVGCNILHPVQLLAQFIKPAQT
jgi:FAD/FMN-containing dehydrogenase/Fe-S oxidoreductase